MTTASALLSTCTHGKITQVSANTDGDVRWVLEGDEDCDELTTEELMWPANITHVP